MPCISLIDIDAITCRNTTNYTLIYGEKKARITQYSFETHPVYIVHMCSTERKFNIKINFEQALEMFFSDEFVEDFREQIRLLVLPLQVEPFLLADRKKIEMDIEIVQHSVIVKLCRDFNSDMHDRNMTIEENGMKLIGRHMEPASNYLPPDSTDLVISGTFEF